MATNSVTPDANRDAGNPGRSVVVYNLIGGHAVFHWGFQSLLVMLPEIQAAFRLSGVGVGGILTVRQVASGIVTLPGGVLVDALRRHWGVLLAACIIGFSVGAFMMGLSPVYIMLLAGVAVASIAHSVWHLLAAAALSHHFPEKRGTSLSLHGIGGAVGDVAGPVVTGALLTLMLWRGILSIYAVVPLFFVLLMFWSFRSVGKKEEADKESAGARSQVEAMKGLLRVPTLWGLAAVYGLRAMSLVALLTVIPLYLDNELGLGPVVRGFHVGVLIAMGLVAKPAAGYLSDRLGRKRVLVPGLVWSCAFSLLLGFYGHGAALTVILVFLGLFLYPDQPILTAAVLDFADSSVASTTLGVVFFVGIISSALSPLVAGALYESLGMGSALYYVAALFGLAAVVFALLPLANPLAARERV